MNRLVPAYALYGEAAAARFPDPLHIETIAARSSIHDWRIRPHRHADLWQIFVLSAGGGTAQLDGSILPLALPMALVVPPLAVHGFSFEPGTQGHVVSIPADTLARSLARDPAPPLAEDGPAALSLGPAELARIAALLAGATEEFAAPARGRDDALAALAALLVLSVRRLRDQALQATRQDTRQDTRQETRQDTRPATAAMTADGRAAREGPRSPRPRPDDSPRLAGGGGQARLVQAFLAQVEADFREQPPLAERARRLSVSLPHLSRACRALLGRSALALVHDRLLLEARRHLVYTSMTVQEIAYGLGFADPAYFTRFFTHRTGRTPTAYRRDGVETRTYS